MTTSTETEATFVVTSCPNNGTKETADFASFRVYVDAANACATTTPAHEHEAGVSCWVCCPSMVIDPEGVLD